jgi:hypothetical protein
MLGAMASATACQWIAQVDDLKLTGLPPDASPDVSPEASPDVSSPGDAGVGDRDEPVDVADARADGGGCVLVPNDAGIGGTCESFETAGALCGAWMIAGAATLATTTTYARTGGAACLVCANGPGVFGLRSTGRGSARAGDLLQSTAFARLQADDGGVDIGMNIVWDPYEAGESGQASIPIHGSALWQEVQIKVTLPEDASQVFLQVTGGAARSGDCFVVDDIAW